MSGWTLWPAHHIILTECRQKCNESFGYQNIQKLDNDMITIGVDNELVT